MFYQRNLSLIAASLNIDSAQAQEIIAAAIPNPVFSFTVHELALRHLRRKAATWQFPRCYHTFNNL